MSTVSFGDLARPTLLKGQNARLQETLQRLTSEMSTGTAADPGRAIGGDYTRLASLESSLAALDAYGKSTALAALYASTQQDSLQAIADSADALAPSLLQAGSAAGQAQMDVLATQGRDALAAALSALNVRAGNRSVFAGAATDGPAVASADTVMTALQAAVAGQTTSGGVAQAVKDWFASPTGFAAVGYTGSATAASPVPIAPGQAADVSTTAIAPAIVDTLAGFALAAMIDAPGIAGDAVQQQGLADAAGQSVLSAATGRAGLQAAIGVAQSRISGAETRNGAEETALRAARTRLLGVDLYQTASDLQATQSQIETLYALTARISGLSLVSFLK